MTEIKDAAYWARTYYDQYGNQKVSLDRVEPPRKPMRWWTILALMGLGVVWWIGFYTILLFVAGLI